MSLPPSYNLLKQHPNAWYIDVGCWDGDSIDLAYQAGFRKVIGIELDNHKYKHCIERFAGHTRMYLDMVNGDSALCLYDCIKHLNVSATIFLDAHSQLFEDEPPMDNPFPLMKEIMQLQRHHIKTHTLIIDDILILTHPQVTGWTLDNIKSWVLAVNPEYKFKLVANPVMNNLLICTV